MKRWIALGILTQAAAWGAVTCSVSATGVAFGTYNTLSSQNADTLGTITVTCTGTVGDPVNYQIALNQGTGSYTAREMAGGTNTMYYNLYTDASRSVVWGDGTGATTKVMDSYTMTSTTVIKNYTVYGRIPGSQSSLGTASYLETLLVTLTY